MGFESFGFSLPWLSSAPAPASTKRKSKPARTRAEQIALRNVSSATSNDAESDGDNASYYPGLVNVSGTYCFMNSTLQALASLSYLHPQIDAIHAKAEALDVPTPVIDALQDLFKSLNTPKSAYHAIRPLSIINALSSPPPPSLYPSSTPIRSAHSLFSSREHQDAQELFQLVSECIKNEMMAVDKEGLRDRGMAGVLDFSLSSSWGPTSVPSLDNAKDLKDDTERAVHSSKSVFDGLTANRRSCVVCGYTEAVMHFGFDNWQLSVPRLATSCRLEDCLEEYTRLEILKDCICRKCSVQATHRRLLQEIETLEEALGMAPSPSTASSSFAALSSSPSTMPSSSPSKSKPSSSKKKRYKEVKKMEQRVRTALEEGRIEDEAFLKDVRLERVVSPASTKQAMIARPPPVLALHLNRSVHYGQYAAKNTIRVHFPEVLDLTPYTTSGSLSTVPTSSISTPSPLPTSIKSISSKASSQKSSSEDSDNERPKRSTTPTPATYALGTQRTLYRLAAIVCHRGQHSFGHYICYRRKPQAARKGKSKAKTSQWDPPTLVDPFLLGESEEGSDDEHPGPGAKKKLKQSERNGTVRASEKPAKKRKPSPFYVEPEYHWEDHSEELAGTGKGWLRISDDDVQECGIETVLADGSGVFMLYYEKVVHPRASVYLQTQMARQGKGIENGHSPEQSNGSMMVGEMNIVPEGVEARLAGGEEREKERVERLLRKRMASRPLSIRAGHDTDTDTLGGTETETETDGDGFSSIGSEETLKPEMKVLDLNGSVGSLISEVGVGVMKVPKRTKGKSRERDVERMSMSLVERSRSDSPMGSEQGWASASVTSSSYRAPFGARIIRSVNPRRASQTPPTSTANGGGSHSNSPLIPEKTHLNGVGQDSESVAVPAEMMASAPSLLVSPLSKPNGVYSHLSATKPGGLGSKQTKVVQAS